PLMTVAQCSYGLYVVHLAVAFALIRYVHHTWWTMPVAGSFVFANIVFVVFAGGASLFVGFASWALLEKRFLPPKRYRPDGAAPAVDPPLRAVSAGSPSLPL